MTFVLKFATFMLLCGSISTIALSQDTMNKSVGPNDNAKKINLTVLLYSQVLHDYVEWGEKAHKLLKTRVSKEKMEISLMLQKWSELALSNDFQSSVEIFKHMPSANPELKNAILFFKGMLTFGKGHKKIKTSLGYTHNAAITLFYQSEKIIDPNLRAIDILKNTYQYLLVNGRFYGAAYRIAQYFYAYKDPQVKAFALKILNNIDNYKILHISTALFQSLAPGLRLWNPNIRGFLALNAARAFGLFKYSSNVVKATAKSSIALFNKGWAYFNAQPLIAKSMEFSLATHVTTFSTIDYYFGSQSPDYENFEKDFLQEMVKPETTTPKTSHYPDISKWYQSLFKSDKHLKDYALLSKKELISQGLDIIKGNNINGQDFSLGSWFIQIEKHLKKDGLPLTDKTVYNYTQGRMAHLNHFADDIFNHSTTTMEKLDTLRKYLIEKYIHNYAPDSSSMMPLISMYGGNCVSQTTLITSTLMPFKKELPPTYLFGVQLFSNHIRPVIYSQRENKIIDLVYGTEEILTNQDASIYKPELLVHATLNKMGGNSALNSMKQEDFLSYRGLLEVDDPSFLMGSPLQKIFDALFYKTPFSFDLSSTATFNAGENTSLRERGQITFEKISQAETIQQRLSNKSSSSFSIGKMLDNLKKRGEKFFSASSFTLYNKVQKERESLCHLSNSYKISFSSRHEYGDYQYNICIDDQKSFEYLQEKNDINYVMSYIINTLEKDFHNLIGTDEYSHLVDFLKSKGTNVESFSDNYAITNFLEKWKHFFYHPPESYYTDSIIVASLTDLCNNLDADINKNDTRPPSLCSIEIDKRIWNTTDFQNYQNELFGALHYWKEHPENFLKVLEKMNHRQRQNLFSLLEGLKGEKIIHTFQALKKEINEYLLTKVSSLDASFKTLYPKKMMDYKIQLPVAENLHSRFLTISSEDPTTNDGKNKDDDNLLRERVETEEESKGDLDKIRPDVLIDLIFSDLTTKKSAMTLWYQGPKLATFYSDGYYKLNKQTVGATVFYISYQNLKDSQDEKGNPSTLKYGNHSSALYKINPPSSSLFLYLPEESYPMLEKIYGPQEILEKIQVKDIQSKIIDQWWP